jgi:hypothetical protein
MKRTCCAVLIAALTPIFAFAQSGNQKPPPNMDEMMKAMGALMSGGTNAAAVVDYRELKALLPAALDGMKRVKASGEKSGAMGMTVAFAEGRYESDAGGNIQIKISDNTGMGGFMAFAHSGWAAAEIDRESDTGFERTTTYGQNKAREEYDHQSKSGKVDILVDGRFMVEVNGDNVPWEAIQAAAKKVDLTKLATLKPSPASTSESKKSRRISFFSRRKPME